MSDRTEPGLDRAGASVGAANPSPTAATVVPPVFRRRDPLHLGIFAVVVAVVIALSSSPFSQGLVGQWSVLAIAGLGFYLAFGVGGQFTFAQAGFVGIGAYTSAWLTQDRGLAFPLALLGAIVVAAAVSAALFVLIRRTSAFYFAIATLAFLFLAVVVFREWDAFAGAGGERRGLDGVSLFGDPLKGRALIIVLSIAVFIALALALLIERSPLGREAAVFRELPIAAPTFGIDTFRIRLSMFVTGSAFGGAAGALLVHRLGVVSPEMFDLPFAIDLFLVLLFGGLGSAWGPILGATFVVWAPEQLRFIGRDQDLVFGALLIVIMIFVPDGLVGIAGRVRSLLAGRRGGAHPAGEVAS